MRPMPLAVLNIASSVLPSRPRSGEDGFVCTQPSPLQRHNVSQFGLDRLLCRVKFVESDLAAQGGKDPLPAPKIVASFLAQATEPRLAARPDTIDREAAFLSVPPLSHHLARPFMVEKWPRDSVRPDLRDIDQVEAASLPYLVP